MNLQVNGHEFQHIVVDIYRLRKLKMTVDYFSVEQHDLLVCM